MDVVLDKRYLVLDQEAPPRGFGSVHGAVCLVDDAGVPVEFGGGGDVAWADVTGKPATFPPVIGTTAVTAMAGNTVIPPAATWANISGKPAVVAAGADAAAARTVIGAGTSSVVVGTGATNAAAGNHTHTAAVVTATAIAPGTATNVQAILSELAARITALETAP